MPHRVEVLRRRVRRALLVRRRLLAAVLAALAVGTALRAAAPPEPARARLVVAAHDVPGGTVLADGDLTTVRWDPAVVPRGAATDAADVVGRRTAAPLRAGEPVTDVRLVGPRLLDGYPGRVAVPVRVGDADALGLLTVGDSIDLVAADPQGSGARVVASSVPVVAIPDTRRSGDVLVSGGLLVVAVTPATARDLAAAGVSAFITPVLTG